MGTDKVSDGVAKSFMCLVAGTSLIKVKPCFSYNSSYLFVAADNKLKVYSTATGQLVHNLAHSKGRIVSVFPNVDNNMQVISVTDEGDVHFWDYEDGILIKLMSLNLTISFAMPAGSSSFYVGVVSNDTEFCKFCIARDGKHSVIIPKIGRSQETIAVGATYAAYIRDNRVIVREMKTSYAVCHLIPDHLSFCCITWHPQEECYATGDSLGRIILWHNFLNCKSVVRTILHWHFHPVQDISFSNAGTYLYSGGIESVLVKWNIVNTTKNFLPRLGFPICFVTCSSDNQFIVTSNEDNSLYLIDNSRFAIEHVIQGLAVTHHWHEQELDLLPAGLHWDPHTNALVLNGRTGHLQFYDVNQDKQLYNLDITQKNYIAKERVRQIFQLEVVKAAIDRNGRWLATVEQRDDKINNIEIRLKLWLYIQEDQKFRLDTSVEMPHWDVVNCLLFEPRKVSAEEEVMPFLITTSNDKRLKIWSYEQDSEDIVDKKKIWTCQRLGYYKDYVCRSASFSDDGSVLAVAFAHALVLWLPTDNVLRAVLCQPQNRDIRHVVFGRCECSHLVATSTQDILVVWDTLSLSALWCLSTDSVGFLVGDINSSVMAVFYDHDLILFVPSSPKPIAVHESITNTKVIAAAFLPLQKSRNSDEKHWSKHSELYFLDENQMLYCVSEEQFTSDHVGKKTTIKIRKHVPLTPFGLLVAEQQKSEVKQLEAKFHQLCGSSQKKIIKEILSTPAHVMPSAVNICKIFLPTMLKPLVSSSKHVDDSDDDDDDDEEEDMDASSSDENERGSSVGDNVKKTFAQLPQKTLQPENKTVEVGRSVAESVVDLLSFAIPQSEVDHMTDSDFSWMV